MKILIAPLNWGLGHASRCIPLIHRYLERGDEVILAGDGDSLHLLQKNFPQLRALRLASLNLRYTNNLQQRGFYFKAILKLIRFTIADHYYLQQLLNVEHFDIIISDNRFGLFTSRTHTIYVTHQLYPKLPKRLKLFEGLARALHACIYTRFNQIWVPDYESLTNNLSGDLSHGGKFDDKVQYIGPQSRFAAIQKIPQQFADSHIIAVLSGLEPQRTIFEQQIIERFSNYNKPLLIVRGKLSDPPTQIKRGNITIRPYMDDDKLVDAMRQAELIIARSGYSTIMDLEVLGLMNKAELHPTPGQSEQEYLADYHKTRNHLDV